MMLRPALMSLCILIGFLLLACSEQPEETQTMPTGTPTTHDIAVKPPPLSSAMSSDGSATESNARRYELGNKHYLFNINDHSVEELQELLERIEEITEASPETFDDLKLVMILHGPDIDLFTKKNYLKNKSVVDLAAKLDAFEIVDMKVCELSIETLGFDRKQIPAFIESVPYAPDTIRALQQQGYINL